MPKKLIPPSSSSPPQATSTRQATLLRRDQALRRDYLRLRAVKAEGGRKPRPKHSVAEIFEKLAKKYHLSVRRVEDIVWKRRG